jgi:hypothetical protein
MTEKDVESALRAVLSAVDKVPDTALQAASAAIGWRTLDRELAQLTAESGLEVAHLRGGQPRLLTFRSEAAVIELEVSSADGVARLLGQLDPPRQAQVTVESAAGSRTARTDSQGRFSFADLRADWMRVVVEAGAAGRTATEWFRA